jgi:hypothetical protein
MMASKGTGPGLTGFFESKDAAEEEESTASNTRMKGFFAQPPKKVYSRINTV